MNTNAIQWRNGLKDGIPICLGYFAVSFTFGIMAFWGGLFPLAAFQGWSFTLAGSHHVLYKSDIGGAICGAGNHCSEGALYGNGRGAIYHKSAILPYVLLSFPEAGRKDAIFSPLPDRIRCYR